MRRTLRIVQAERGNVSNEAERSHTQLEAERAQLTGLRVQRDELLAEISRARARMGYLRNEAAQSSRPSDRSMVASGTPFVPPLQRPQPQPAPNIVFERSSQPQTRLPYAHPPTITQPQRSVLDSSLARRAGETRVQQIVREQRIYPLNTGMVLSSPGLPAPAQRTGLSAQAQQRPLGGSVQDHGVGTHGGLPMLWQDEPATPPTHAVGSIAHAATTLGFSQAAYTRDPQILRLTSFSANLDGPLSQVRHLSEQPDTPDLRKRIEALIRQMICMAWQFRIGICPDLDNATPERMGPRLGALARLVYEFPRAACGDNARNLLAANVATRMATNRAFASHLPAQPRPHPTTPPQQVVDLGGQNPVTSGRRSYSMTQLLQLRPVQQRGVTQIPRPPAIQSQLTSLHVNRSASAAQVAQALESTEDQDEDEETGSEEEEHRDVIHPDNQAQQQLGGPPRGFLPPHCPPPGTIQLRRFSPVPRDVSYTIQNGTSEPMFIARFDWREGRARDRLAHIPCDSQVIGGVLRVYVEHCLAFGLSMARVDQLVAFEIEMAVHAERITEELGEEYWSAWCGSGEDKMSYGTALEENGMDSPTESHAWPRPSWVCR